VEHRIYIIQLTEAPERTFFVRLRDGLVHGSEYPSYAAHLEYAVADEIAQRIRSFGYPDSVVCDRHGEPVTAADLGAAQIVPESAIAEYWDDKPRRGAM